MLGLWSTVLYANGQTSQHPPFQRPEDVAIETTKYSTCGVQKTIIDYSIVFQRGYAVQHAGPTVPQRTGPQTTDSRSMGQWSGHWMAMWDKIQIGSGSPRAQSPESRVQMK